MKVMTLAAHEIAGLVPHICVICRLPLCMFLTASKGNKTETSLPLLFSCVLSLPLLGMYIYFVMFQTYV